MAIRGAAAGSPWPSRCNICLQESERKNMQILIYVVLEVFASLTARLNH
ncbi:MAG: hypothetical protein HY075_05150 [Deltaproteobacteria bacterium]|nr:hypothetical protein [Deltaproteobacteria bacterium]